MKSNRENFPFYVALFASFSAAMCLYNYLTDGPTWLIALQFGAAVFQGLMFLFIVQLSSPTIKLELPREKT